MDSAGNVYISDFNNCRLLKYSSAGVWSVLVTFSSLGLGLPCNPGLLALDPSGAVWVLLEGEAAVQVLPNGQVNQQLLVLNQAGNGIFLSSGVAVDAAGNVYLSAENSSGTAFILRYSPLQSSSSAATRAVSSSAAATSAPAAPTSAPVAPTSAPVAPTSARAAATSAPSVTSAATPSAAYLRLSSVSTLAAAFPARIAGAIALDSSNHLWGVSGSSLVQYTLQANGSLVFTGQFADSDGNQLEGLAVDAQGDVLSISETFDQGLLPLVERWAPNGTRLAGFTAAYTTALFAIAVSPVTGNIYVADGGDGYPGYQNGVSIFTPSGTRVGTLGGSPAISFGPQNDTQGVAVDTAGNVYISDTTNCRLVKYSAGAYSVVVNFTALGLGLPCFPGQLTLDPSGSVWVLLNSLIIAEVLPSGALQQLIDVSQAPGLGINYVQGVTVDPAGNVYVAASSATASYVLRYSPRQSSSSSAAARPASSSAAATSAPAAPTSAPVAATSAPVAPTSTPAAATSAPTTSYPSATVCVLSYGLPNTVDYPFSIAYSLRVTYSPTPVTSGSGQVYYTLQTATGTRAYTNRFGVTSSTTVQLLGSAQLYSRGVPFNGAVLYPSTPVQQPGLGPLVPTTRLVLANASGVLSEQGTQPAPYGGDQYSFELDPLGQAYLSSIPGFVNTTLGAGTTNALAVNYAACLAPITFTNGLRPPTQPSASNGALQIAYSYTVSDGLTYSVTANLTFTTSSAFATTQDALGNPYQTITGIGGTRAFTNLLTGVTSTSTAAGLSAAGTGVYGVPNDQRFYPYSLLASSPGVYPTIDSAPFWDGEGLYYLTTMTSVSLRVEDIGGTATLVEYSTNLPATAGAPKPALQRQTYMLM